MYTDELLQLGQIFKEASESIRENSIKANAKTAKVRPKIKAKLQMQKVRLLDKK